MKGYKQYKLEEAVGLMEYRLLQSETSTNYNYSKLYEKYLLLKIIIKWYKTIAPALTYLWNLGQETDTKI